MKKIISLFQRDYEGTRLVFNAVMPGAEWVLAGEGVATRKFDGMCVKVEGGQLFKRYDAKHGKTLPPDFIPAQEPDPVSGHWPGWIAVTDGPQDKWFREALVNDDASAYDYEDGTYELCGPRVNGNPEGFERHVLVRHGWLLLPLVPREFDGLKKYLDGGGVEGIVWYRDNGDMVKIKAKDFGVRR